MFTKDDFLDGLDKLPKPERIKRITTHLLALQNPIPVCTAEEGFKKFLEGLLEKEFSEQYESN